MDCCIPTRTAYGLLQMLPTIRPYLQNLHRIFGLSLSTCKLRIGLVHPYNLAFFWIEMGLVCLIYRLNSIQASL